MECGALSWLFYICMYKKCLSFLRKSTLTIQNIQFYNGECLQCDQAWGMMEEGMAMLLTKVVMVIMVVLMRTLVARMVTVVWG